MVTAVRTETNGLSGAITFSNVDNVKLTTAGPELLGVPKAPTAAASTSTTQVATTAFVTSAIAAAVLDANAAAPSNLLPLQNTPGGAVGSGLSYARGDHVHPSDKASNIVNTPGGNVSATDVQSAIYELDGDKLAVTGGTLSGSLNINSSTGNLVVSSGNTIIQVGGYNGCIDMTATPRPFVDFKTSLGTDYNWRISYASDVANFPFVIENNAGKAFSVLNDGSTACTGQRGRSGVNGTGQINIFNMFWNGSAVQLWVDGTNVGTINVTSDARIKKDVVDLAPMTATVQALRPVSYLFEDVSLWLNDGIHRAGFIAQEVMAVVPSVVSGSATAMTHNDPDNTGPVEPQPLQLDPMQLVAILTKALQETITRVEALEAYAAAHP